MHDDLASARDGIAERFVPERDEGRLIAVEHLARYHWAAQAARERSVLDAGCGVGYGSAILAEGGARDVVGVDLAADVIAAVAPDHGPTVALRAGDVRALDFPDGRFDLVVCFEVLEHLDDPFAALDELVRVLAPEGLLLLSSPNRGVYPPGNPHHRHEFTPHELETALRERVDHVRLVRQSDYIVSALLGDETLRLGGGEPLGDLELRKLEAGEPGSETYTIALAGRVALPDIPELAALAGTLELREWLSAFATQTEAIAAKDAYIAELGERLGERDRVAELLTEAELALASIPELRELIASLEYELISARSAAEVARREARDLDRALLYGRRVLRHVRPLIQLLRKVRRRLRRA